VNVVRGRPPNFDEIAAALPSALTRGAIFCYGDTIFNPDGVRLSPALRAHEAVHAQRQGKTDEAIRGWWKSYLADAKFRLDEELPAHQAEFKTFCRLERDKEQRHRFLVGLAQRLSGPLYGGLIDFHAAKRAIRSGESFNGRTVGSEPADEGSNPSSPTSWSTYRDRDGNVQPERRAREIVPR
jgi:hypothetical protein